jgi:rRNA maturation protein Nop10
MPTSTVVDHIPTGVPIRISNTHFQITQNGPEVTWKLELIKNSGQVLLDFILPPAFSLDRPWTMYRYSNAMSGMGLLPLIEFEIRLKWNTDKTAIAEVYENIDPCYY